MAATIPSLWPDINVDLVPPVTILRAQANKLGQLTKGILEAEVTTVTGDEDFAVHRLDLLAPALDDRRVRVLTATHRADYYPLQLEAECFRPKRSPLAAPAPVPPPDHLPESREWPRKNDWRPVVANQEEFLTRLGEVLRSMEVRAAIDSMIALSNQTAHGPNAGEKSSNGVPDSPPTG